MVEAAPHTAKNMITWINLCVEVPPAPVYKGAREEEAGPRRGRAKCEVLLGLPSPSRIPPTLLEYEKGKEGERKKERGAAPLVQFGPEGGAQASFLLASLLCSCMAQ